MYVTNAFSLNMLPSLTAEITAVEITLESVKQIAEAGLLNSAIGHADTASVVSTLLGSEFEPNRISLKLDEGEVVIVAQYYGPRLPEGSTQLPEGAEIKWVAITHGSCEHPISSVATSLRRLVAYTEDTEEKKDRAYQALNWHRIAVKSS